MSSITKQRNPVTPCMRQSQASPHTMVGAESTAGSQSSSSSLLVTAGLLMKRLVFQYYITRITRRRKALAFQKLLMIKSSPFSHICFPLKTINIKKVLLAVLSPPHRPGFLLTRSRQRENPESSDPQAQCGCCMNTGTKSPRRIHPGSTGWGAQVTAMWQMRLSSIWQVWQDRLASRRYRAESPVRYLSMPGWGKQKEAKLLPAAE